MLLPVCQIVIIIIWQALPQKVTVTQVTGLEVGVFHIQAFNKLHTRCAAEAAGAAGWHGVGRVLGACLAALVSSTSGRWSITSLKTRTGLTMAPGERGRAVGQARYAASVGFITVIAHITAVQAAGKTCRGKGYVKLYVPVSLR